MLTLGLEGQTAPTHGHEDSVSRLVMRITGANFSMAYRAYQYDPPSIT